MFLRKTIVAILLVLSLTACSTTQSKLKRIDIGMTYPQVEGIMGGPDSTQTVRKADSLSVLFRYDHRICNANLSIYERCDFFVIFLNGKVTETITKKGNEYGPHSRRPLPIPAALKYPAAEGTCSAPQILVGIFSSASATIRQAGTRSKGPRSRARYRNNRQGAPYGRFRANFH